MECKRCGSDHAIFVGEMCDAQEYHGPRCKHIHKWAYPLDRPAIRVCVCGAKQKWGPAQRRRRNEDLLESATIVPS